MCRNGQFEALTSSAGVIVTCRIAGQMQRPMSPILEDTGWHVAYHDVLRASLACVGTGKTFNAM